MDKTKNRVYISDKMVLIALGFGAVYWIIECLIYVFLSYEINFMDRLFGPNLADLSTRIIVISLFLFFGSHAQYKINEKKQIEDELSELKEVTEKLKRDLEAQKNKQ